ncbi:hypothetical protein [Persephonella sp.]
MNDNAQVNASAVIIENASVSAVNKSANILGVGGDITNSTITQSTNQTARNFENEATAGFFAYAGNGESEHTQLILNQYANIEKQNNNNNSVQLNDNAQSDTSALIHWKMLLTLQKTQLSMFFQVEILSTGN